MIDPKKILRFLEEHFDEIKDIYTLYKTNGAINQEELDLIFKNSILLDNLIEYEIILLRADGTYVLNEIYASFISFLLDDFALDMPEQIEKYYNSLDSLFRKLKSLTSKNDTFKTVEALKNEINQFENQLKKNIRKLVKETKDIKANNKKLDYHEKLKKASELTKTYIEPLNTILQTHSGSILHILEGVISLSVNQKFNHDDIRVRRYYASLYNSFDNIKKEILSENRILINEVMPLLDRIKTGSDILTGCINFLNNSDFYDVPKLLDKKNHAIYMENAEYLARDIWEGFSDTDEDIIINEAVKLKNVWLYDKEKYKNNLLKALPIDNFYIWIYEELSMELGKVESDKFFALSKLIFENDIAIKYANEKIDIRLVDKILNVPIIEMRSMA